MEKGAGGGRASLITTSLHPSLSPSPLSPCPAPRPSFHEQSAAIVYSKAGGALASFSPSPTSLLAGDALGSASLLTFFLWWALAHNFCHLYS